MIFLVPITYLGTLIRSLPTKEQAAFLVALRHHESLPTKKKTGFSRSHF